MQRSQSDDNARHVGLRPDPLIRESKEEAWRHRSIHAPTPSVGTLLDQVAGDIASMAGPTTVTQYTVLIGME
jgi:hypothetical protein